ncbi:MAG: hypothetical protein JXQ75_02610 [Phycisphaerae bacterium]|nr:hypothetical protein [Phycisphaerae bacterium]
MDCKSYQDSASGGRAFASVHLFAVFLACVPTPAWAEEQPKVSPGQIKQMKQLEDHAGGLGSWDRQYLAIEDAVDNVFQQQGWNSEPDQYARSLMRDVGRISPWKPQERTKAFMDGVQVRYGLTHDQRTSFEKDIHRESIRVAVKHLGTTLPIAIEAIQTRSSNQPFTAEQVQRWSQKLSPLMDESLQTVERVVGRLEKTMTQEQREILEADMKALRKRHSDMEKMVEKWQAGNWDPRDWGLQNDPIHAGAMADILALEEEKDARVEAAQLKDTLDEEQIATDESTWDKYVRWFCDKYECTDAQRTQAAGILKGSKTEAITFRNARSDLIDKCERLSQSAETEALRNYYAQQLDKELAPIAEVFGRLKARLHEQVLTTEQRAKFATRPPEEATAPPEQRTAKTPG